MELSVIENDHSEVKKYLENFVPDNYYRVLGDAYLYQVRAVLLHAVRNPGEYNARYDALINALTAQFEDNRVSIGNQISTWADKQGVHAQRLNYLETENSTVQGSITELEKAIINVNKIYLEKTNKLEAQIKDVEIGGVNLIHNSTFDKGYEAIGDVSVSSSDYVLGTLYKCENIGDTESAFGIGSTEEFYKIKLIEGKQYTLSFYGYGDVNSINQIKLIKGDSVHVLDPVVMGNDITDRRVITFNAPFSGDDIGFSIATSGFVNGSWFTVVAIQLELGGRATDWAPSPFDDADYIARVAASLEEFRSITIGLQEATVQALDNLRANIGKNTGEIQNEREINLERNRTTVRQLDELTALSNDNLSKITNLDTATSTRFEANATKLVELEASVGASNAAIERLDTVSSTNTSAIASTSNSLSAKIDGLEIGGRNLIRNSTFKLGHMPWGSVDITRTDTVLGSEIEAISTEAGQFGIQNDALFHTISLVEGKEYTLSMYANGNIDSINSIWLRSEGNEPQLLPPIAVTESMAEKKSITFVSSMTANNISLIIAAAGYPVGSWFKFIALQLEKGNKATDWTEAPEDTTDAIAATEANINEYKEARALADEASAKKVSELSTKVGQSEGRIDDLDHAITNPDGTVVKRITTLSASIEKAMNSSDVQYYLSDSPTEPVGGSWVTHAPEWQDGKYMFSRTKVSFIGGVEKFLPSANGTNISGARGQQGLPGLEGKRGEQGLKGEKGEDGLSSYTHLAYATSPMGAGLSVSHFPNATYVGMYVDNIPEDSTDPTKYNWSLIRGTDGADGIPGKAGEDGRTPYIHIAYATSDDGSTGFSITESLGKTYIGQYTDFTKADSTDASKYKWSLIKGDDGIDGYTPVKGVDYFDGIDGQDGSDGDSAYQSWLNEGNSGTTLDFINALRGADGVHGKDGIPGAKGEDGITHYTWIKYSNNPDGSGLSNDPTDKKYMGLAFNKTTATESNDKDDYTWSLIKGSDGLDGVDGLEGPKGEQGIKGEKGEDGKSSYTHLAYATSETGAGFSKFHYSNATYIGMYVDDIKEDSNSPSKYNWSLIKGADGAKGIPGQKGEDGLRSYLHIAYANNSTGSLDFSTTDSTDKKYIGQYTDTNEDDSNSPSRYKWTLIKGDKGDTGSTGSVGQGIASIVEQYAISTSKITAPSSWSETMPTWSTGLYVWTRSRITYKNPTEIAYTEPLVNSAWEAVNDIEIGGRNLYVLSATGSGYESSGKLVASTPTHKTMLEPILVKGQKFITYQHWNPSKWVNNSNTNRIGFLTESMVHISSVTVPRVTGAEYETKLITVPENAHYALLGAIVNPNDLNAVKIKYEFGNIPTDWTPAPEDTDNAIEASITHTNDVAATISNGLKAKIGITTNVAGKVSGWESENDGTSSDFSIMADAFYVYTGTSDLAPFKVVGNELHADELIVNTANIRGSLTVGHIPSETREEITAAKSTADSAVGKANAAQDTADKAKEDAATAQSTVDNLEIGGRNLLEESNLFSTGNTGAGITTKINSDGTLEITAAVGNGNHAGNGIPKINSIIPKLKDGDTITVSVDIKGVNITKDSPPSLYLASGMGYLALNGALTEGEWVRVSHTRTYKSVTSLSPHWGFSGLAGIYTIKNLKIEKGNKATDWSPAPEDVNAAIESVADDLDELDRALSTYKNTTKDAFEDGLISKSEALAIKSHKNQLLVEKDELDEKYTSIYSSPYLDGSAKSNLYNAKVNLNNKYSDLANYIDSVTANGTVTSSQSSAVDAKFSSYSSSIRTLAQRFEEANNSIIATAKSDAEKLAAKNLGMYEVSDYVDGTYSFEYIFNPVESKNIKKMVIHLEQKDLEADVNVFINGNDLGAVNGRNNTREWNYFNVPSSYLNTSSDNIVKIENVANSSDAGYVYRIGLLPDTVSTSELTEKVDEVKNNIYYRDTTEIDGGNIRTGTVTAHQIDSTNLNVHAANITGSLNANQISTGTLSAISGNLGSITAGSININNKFKVSSSGDLVATSGTFSGNLNGAGGTFNGLISAGTVTGSNISGSNIVGGNISGSTITGGSINIGGGNLTVNSNGELLAKSGTFEGTVLANQISGTIDIATMKRSAWMPGFKMFIIKDLNALRAFPEDYDSVRQYSSLLPSYGGLSWSTGSGGDDSEIGGVMFEIEVDVQYPITVSQKAFVIDNKLYLHVNGEYIGLYNSRYPDDSNGGIITFNLIQGINKIQYVLYNTNAECSISLLGDFIDNGNVKFA